MAHETRTIRSPRPPADVFAYVSDLRHLADWDPGVHAVTQVDGDGGGPDTVFDVAVDTGPSTTTFRYTTTRFDPPRSLTVVARTRLFESVDTIEVEPADHGCLVRYDARLDLRGPLRIGDLALRPVFRRICDRAGAGLAQALDGELVDPRVTPGARHQAVHGDGEGAR